MTEDARAPWIVWFRSMGFWGGRGRLLCAWDSDFATDNGTTAPSRAGREREKMEGRQRYKAGKVDDARRSKKGEGAGDKGG